jgi:hypothetical protein
MKNNRMKLYHYCSNAALVSILSSREIWASDLSLANDHLEGKWIRNVFEEYCRDKKVENYLIERLSKQLENPMSFLGAAGFCLSEDGDLLSQWRGYADDATGVSIGFNKDYFEMLGQVKLERGDEFNASLKKIEYQRDKQKEMIAEHADEIIDLAKRGAGLPLTILGGAGDKDAENERLELSKKLWFLLLPFTFNMHAMKNPAFQEEREWRLISHIVNRLNATVLGMSKMDFRASGNRLIPFRRISLEPLSEVSILEIILGPKNITPDNVVAAILARYNWKDVKVIRSTASYR